MATGIFHILQESRAAAPLPWPPVPPPAAAAHLQPVPAPSMQERQRLHQCLRHTLNNMFQTSQFSSGELDAIADALAPGRLPLPFLHPHRTLWFGNYDVNVMDVALRRHGKVRVGWGGEASAGPLGLGLPTRPGTLLMCARNALLPAAPAHHAPSHCTLRRSCGGTTCGTRRLSGWNWRPPLPSSSTCRRVAGVGGQLAQAAATGLQLAAPA